MEMRLCRGDITPLAPLMRGNCLFFQSSENGSIILALAVITEVFGIYSL